MSGHALSTKKRILIVIRTRIRFFFKKCASFSLFCINLLYSCYTAIAFKYAPSALREVQSKVTYLLLTALDGEHSFGKICLLLPYSPGQCALKRHKRNEREKSQVAVKVEDKNDQKYSKTHASWIFITVVWYSLALPSHSIFHAPLSFLINCNTTSSRCKTAWRRYVWQGLRCKQCAPSVSSEGHAAALLCNIDRHRNEAIWGPDICFLAPGIYDHTHTHTHKVCKIHFYISCLYVLRFSGK